MPYLDPAKQAEYGRKWIARRRAEWLAAHGPCKQCGSWDRLEVHHRDPEQKTTHRVWSWSAARRAAELAKCDVLCHVCHLEETKAQFRRPITHGTRSGYSNGCRCDACREASAKYRRTWIRRPSARARVVGPRTTRCEACALDISYLAIQAPRFCSSCTAQRGAA